MFCIRICFLFISIEKEEQSLVCLSLAGDVSMHTVLTFHRRLLSQLKYLTHFLFCLAVRPKQISFIYLGVEKYKSLLKRNLPLSSPSSSIQYKFMSMSTNICQKYRIKKKIYDRSNITCNIDNDYFLVSSHLFLCSLLLFCCAAATMILTIQ